MSAIVGSADRPCVKVITAARRPQRHIDEPSERGAASQQGERAHGREEGYLGSIG